MNADDPLHVNYIQGANNIITTCEETIEFYSGFHPKGPPGIEHHCVARRKTGSTTPQRIVCVCVCTMLKKKPCIVPSTHLNDKVLKNRRQPIQQSYPSKCKPLNSILAWSLTRGRLQTQPWLLLLSASPPCEKGKKRNSSSEVRAVFSTLRRLSKPKL